MTAAVRKLLADFDRLSLADQHQVAQEILIRMGVVGELSGGQLDELAAELFRRYDDEELSSARPAGEP